ncbi:hypothetical protein ANCCAN_00003 [Ancylostoma caninum]|uniref:Uncharacterized protein n=1 Tax=Ancylostoma caninum TaxID=29170 RepID=A0A368HDM4_ANCCA|nr:hypothetical protein ANCCAN_00003 [Ancylostoma caninum]
MFFRRSEHCQWFSSREPRLAPLFGKLHPREDCCTSVAGPPSGGTALKMEQNLFLPRDLKLSCNGLPKEQHNINGSFQLKDDSSLFPRLE